MSWWDDVHTRDDFHKKWERTYKNNTNTEVVKHCGNCYYWERCIIGSESSSAITHIGKCNDPERIPVLKGYDQYEDSLGCAHWRYAYDDLRRHE